ncbi:unnamed protein product [Caenorhabditis sp. 36 PRJEB53466]|nr:unnamed protein product [Caenorhabditis sp. 36 PRJEB53466]
MDEDETPEIKFIDQDDYERYGSEEELSKFEIRWIDSYEQEKKLSKLLSLFLAPIHRQLKLGYRITHKYVKTLQYQGAEVFGLNDTRLRVMSPRAIETTGNLPYLLQKISEVRKSVNLAHYIATVINKMGVTSENPYENLRSTIYERMSHLYLFHQGYRPGLEYLLANYRMLRQFRFISASHAHVKEVQKLYRTDTAFMLYPQANLLALQSILDDWNCPFKIDKILQIAHANTLQMRTLYVKGDVLAVLNEALLCVLAFNNGEAQEEIENFDSIVGQLSTNQKQKRRLQLWKMISKFERVPKLNPQGFLINAQRLEEECVTEDIGPECTVMVETACKIRSLCQKQEEEIAKTMLDTATRYPSLGPRMMQIAEKCNIGYEADVLMEQICDSSDPNTQLHPSEPTWLVYVEKQMSRIGKNGSIRQTLQKLLRVMFEFLDFDSNRLNEKAWELMKTVLELSDPSLVVPEWETRRNWWSRFHKTRARDGRKMRKEARSTKRSVLEALESFLT